MIRAVMPSFRLRAIAEDPTDNKIIECAVAGEADYIVSGDRHVLDLLRYRNIAVVTPNNFLKNAL